MQKSTISTTLHLKWQFIHDEKYKLSTCGKLLNQKSGRLIKQALNCLSYGYWINRKFYPLTTIKKQGLFQPIKNEIKCPF